MPTTGSRLRPRGRGFEKKPVPEATQIAILEALTRMGLSGAYALARELVMDKNELTRHLHKMQKAGTVTHAGQHGTWSVTVKRLTIP